MKSTDFLGSSEGKKKHKTRPNVKNSYLNYLQIYPEIEVLPVPYPRNL